MHAATWTVDVGSEKERDRPKSEVFAHFFFQVSHLLRKEQPIRAASQQYQKIQSREQGVGLHSAGIYLKPRYLSGKICVRCQPNVCFARHTTQLAMTTVDEPAWQITPEKVQAVVQRLIQIGRPKKIILFGLTFGVMRLGIATSIYWLWPAMRWRARVERAYRLRSSVSKSVSQPGSAHRQK
jgi:hypothetical protein